MIGKLPPDMLLKYVMSRTGSPDPSVVVGPSIGEDAAVVDLGDGRVLVVHADPITGAVELLGWLAVHVPCNDIAVRGVRPRWLLPVLYLPEGAGEDLVDAITGQMDGAARELGVAIVGGHTEFTPGLNRPLVSSTAIGVGERGRYVTTSGARVGDAVIMTKTAGVEGTAILATDFAEALLKAGVPGSLLERARGFTRRVSVVGEALALAEAGLATSMHDPTEGGVLGGLAEMAYASGKTLHVWEERIRIAEETLAVTSALSLDPLRLISSGTLLATVPAEKVGEALETLRRAGVEAAVVGYVGKRSGDFLVMLYRRDGTVERVSRVYVEEELYRAWRARG